VLSDDSRPAIGILGGFSRCGPSANPGTVCLFLNGAAGKFSTRFTRHAQTFDEVYRFGALLGAHVLALLDHAETSALSLAAATKSVDMLLRALRAWPAHNFQASGNARIDQTRAEGAVIETQLGQAVANRDSLPVTLAALRIRPWKLLGVPGEPFNELAAELRAISPWNLVLGYTNDYLGYFATRQAVGDATHEALQLFEKRCALWQATKQRVIIPVLVEIVIQERFGHNDLSKDGNSGIQESDQATGQTRGSEHQTPTVLYRLGEYTRSRWGENRCGLHTGRKRVFGGDCPEGIARCASTGRALL